MKIIGIKDGHDGALAYIDDNKLIFSIEPEKDSFPRCSNFNSTTFLNMAKIVPSAPDTIAVSGWTKGIFSSESNSFAGYYGSHDSHIQMGKAKLFGQNLNIFSSTHEQSHIWCAYGMAPIPMGEPCYILVWEGNIGNFYYVDQHLEITDLGCVLEDPGNKYTFLYSLADIESPSMIGFYDTSHPGKMMALAAYGQVGDFNEDEKAIADAILGKSRFELMSDVSKSDFAWSPYYNIGVESQEFKNLARKFTDRLFNIFFEFAESNCMHGLPLLIAGGCGLNCEWNSKWRECGLFSEVFVPPCTNDSGSAIGTAIHALWKYTGTAKVRWSAYAGESFVHDIYPPHALFTKVDWPIEHIAANLSSGSIIAWIEGNYEIGPRSLGHRSLIAEPFHISTRDKLNRIKKREHFRPISPICLADEVGQHFTPDLPSEHMLYFYRVKNMNLRAVTHVDGSSRTQTLKDKDAPYLAQLLRQFSIDFGCGILCNTSLNFKGKGFINRMSDIVKYVSENEIDGFVVDGVCFWKTNLLNNIKT